MNVRTTEVDITTSSLGAFSNEYQVGGPLVLQVVYEAGSNISSAADLLITDSLTAMTILSATDFGSTAGFTKLPRRLIADADDGSESTSNVYDYMAVNQKITVAVSGATAAAQTGKLFITCG